MSKASYMLVLAAVLSLLAASTLPQRVFAAAAEPSVARVTGEDSVLLDVNPIQQSQPNSCGESASAIAYNYANPARPIAETDVIRYALSQGLYTPDSAPFTSPAAMGMIGTYFSGPTDSGNASTAQDGLAVLQDQLQAGQPVIIDVTTNLYDISSGAHFIVVTGYLTDLQSGDTLVTYNNPLTGQQEGADWSTLWKAWANNGDPGGSGWWMVIPTSLSAEPSGQ